MDSYPFRLSDGLCSFSPNGLFLSSCNHRRITIYSLLKSSECQIFQCLSSIELLEWSPDSELILSAYPTNGKLEVWSVSNQEWHCKISTGSSGLQTAMFSPNSRSVLTISYLHLRLTIWSLTDHTVWHINLPKLANPTIDFSVGGVHMALAERRTGKDCVGIYTCDSWSELAVVHCDTIDLSGLRWSPDGSKLAIWDGVGNGKLCIFNVNGLRLAEISQVFGIHDVLWSPTAQLIMVATVGSKVKLVNHLTWHSITSFQHVNIIRETLPCIVYKETENSTKYVTLQERPLALTNNTPCGMVWMTASSDGRFVATIDREHPTLLWVWDIPLLRLTAVLIQRNPVKCFKWSTKGTKLAIACGTTSAYIWAPTGCAVVDLRASLGLKADKIEWHNSCQLLMVSSRDIGCVLKLDLDA